MDLRDPVARMLNTCLIGRRWKPREGWSRPVLTGDGDITFRSSCGGLVPRLSCAGSSWTAICVGMVTNTIQTIGFASRPLAGSQTATDDMPVWIPLVSLPWPLDLRWS